MFILLLLECALTHIQSGVSFRFTSYNTWITPFNKQLNSLIVYSRPESKSTATNEFSVYEYDMSEDDEYSEEEIDELLKSPLNNTSSSKVKQNDHEWMFFDIARINVQGGDGGDGCMAMRREYKIEHGGPSGGNGGPGGNVYLLCDDTLNTLALLRRKVHHKAKDGTNGRGEISLYAYMII